MIPRARPPPAPPPAPRARPRVAWVRPCPTGVGHDTADTVQLYTRIYIFKNVSSSQTCGGAQRMHTRTLLYKTHGTVLFNFLVCSASRERTSAAHEYPSFTLSLAQPVSQRSCACFCLMLRHRRGRQAAHCHLNQCSHGMCYTVQSPPRGTARRPLVGAHVTACRRRSPPPAKSRHCRPHASYDVPSQSCGAPLSSW